MVANVMQGSAEQLLLPLQPIRSTLARAPLLLAQLARPGQMFRPSANAIRDSEGGLLQR